MTIEAIRFRAEGEHIVLQVLESQKRSGSYSYDVPPVWRDAKVEDLLEAARFTSALDVLQGIASSIHAHWASSKTDAFGSENG